MPLKNSNAQFGSVAKTFHWLTALLILSALVVGFIAAQAPYSDDTELARKAWLFSLHKTIGVTAFFVAFFRILWALTQPRPRLLNGDHRLEAIAAETAHWLLYGAMLLVPLTGWMHHAATTGYAPIWGPFGQTLPFVPKSEPFASLMGQLHYIFMLVLLATLAAHIGGALKHAIFDRDQTLQRMLPGRAPTTQPSRQQPGHAIPALTALSVWIAALFIGSWAFTAPTDTDTPDTQLASVTSEWQVDSGTLGLAVRQMGSDVRGEFTDWTAEITFDETPTDGSHGDVRVTVRIPSLTLGSVTSQALGADYLDSESFDTAVFEAELLPGETGYIARGTLTLKGIAVPVDLPFSLTLDGDRADMSGQTTLDRRNFKVGDNMSDESTLGFAVEINVTLTATRGEAPKETIAPDA